DNLKSGNMTLSVLDLAHPEQHADLAEKMIRKLRVGLMPPAGAKRPDREVVNSFVGTLETELDVASAANLNPGTRPSQRLTRAEYTNSIRDMLGVDIDAAKY